MWICLCCNYVIMKTHNGREPLVTGELLPRSRHCVLGYSDVCNHFGQLVRFSDLSLKSYEKSESPFYSEGDQCSYSSSYRVTSNIGDIETSGERIGVLFRLMYRVPFMMAFDPYVIRKVALISTTIFVHSGRPVVDDAYPVSDNHNGV